MMVEQRDGKVIVSVDPTAKRREQLAAKPNRTQAETLELILLQQTRIENKLDRLLNRS